MFKKYRDAVNAASDARSVQGLLVFFTIFLIPVTLIVCLLLLGTVYLIATVPHFAITLGIIVIGGLIANTLWFFYARNAAEDAVHIYKQAKNGKIRDEDYDPDTYPREF
jgi:hypothetical protein